MSRKLAVYTITFGKEDLARRSFRSLHKMAGIQFDHYVWDQGSSAEFRDWLSEQHASGSIKYLCLSEKNVGQQIAANYMLDEIQKGEYNWILRWDPDALAKSRRFLRKLIRFGEHVMRHGELPILSPRISKLGAPPDAIHKGHEPRLGEYEVVLILGGVCRLHPAVFFDEFRFNAFLPMAMGEAAEVADRVTALATAGRPWVTLRLPGLEVEHAYGEQGQIERYPESFTIEREVGRAVSYGY